MLLPPLPVIQILSTDFIMFFSSMFSMFTNALKLQKKYMNAEIFAELCVILASPQKIFVKFNIVCDFSIKNCGNTQSELGALQTLVPKCP